MIIFNILSLKHQNIIHAFVTAGLNAFMLPLSCIKYQKLQIYKKLWESAVHGSPRCQHKNTLGKIV